VKINRLSSPETFRLQMFVEGNWSSTVQTKVTVINYSILIFGAETILFLIVFNLSLTLLLVLSPKFHHITPILKFLHWLKINERIKYKVLSLAHINLSKLVNLLTSLSSFIPFTSLYSVLVFFSYHP